jgi:hypothetical protein
LDLKTVTRDYPFYPAWNGKKASPVVKWFVMACGRRWGLKNLGIYVNRPVRNIYAKGALSVHATGWACDLGYPSTKAGRRTAVEAFHWLVEHSETLRVAAIHDYRYGAVGRAYRCSRGEGWAGVKVYKNVKESAGRGGNYLHVEIDNSWGSVKEFVAAWKSLPKP